MIASGGVALVNAMSVEGCRAVVAYYTTKYSITDGNDKGCLISTLEFGGNAAGLCYAVAQSIPAEHVPEAWVGAPKSKLKGMLHLFAYKAHTGENIPAEMEVTHICGMGKRSIKGDFTRGCFLGAHLTVKTHAANMSEINCKSLEQCNFCGLINIRCTHTPRCVATLALEAALEKQQQPISITIKYSDGTKQKISVVY